LQGMRGIGFKQMRTIAAVIKRHSCEVTSAHVSSGGGVGKGGGEPTHDDELKCPKRGATTVKWGGARGQAT
jgi:hypothetical protein